MTLTKFLQELTMKKFARETPVLTNLPSREGLTFEILGNLHKRQFAPVLCELLTPAIWEPKIVRGFYAILPNTSDKFYVGRVDSPHGHAYMVDPIVCPAGAQMASVVSKNFYHPLIEEKSLNTTEAVGAPRPPPPTRSRVFRRSDGKYYRVDPQPLASIDERSRSLDWDITIPKKTQTTAR